MKNNYWKLIKTYKDINATKFIINDYECNKWSFLVIHTKLDGYNIESNLFMEIPKNCPNQLNISNNEVRIDFYTAINTMFLVTNDNKRRIITSIDYYQFLEEEISFNFINEFKKEDKISKDLDINSFKIENDVIKPIYDELKEYFNIEIKNKIKEYSYQKIQEVEINDIFYIFKEFNPKYSYKFYFEITKDKKTYLGELNWLNGLDLDKELHNSINDFSSTSSNNAIFTPNLKKLEVKEWGQKNMIINKITIYCKKEIS